MCGLQDLTIYIPPLLIQLNPHRKLHPKRTSLCKDPLPDEYADSPTTTRPCTQEQDAGSTFAYFETPASPITCDPALTKYDIRCTIQKIACFDDSIRHL